jgi:hypothetical protein
MTTPEHILAKEGILTTFSIAKKVTAKDVKKLRDKIKTAKMDVDKLHELLRMSIIKDTQKDIETQKIPGLIIAGTEAAEEKKRIMELTYFSEKISKKLMEKNLDKYYLCYIINAIVNMMGLDEEAFENFHKKFSKFKNKENESEDSDE